MKKQAFTLAEVLLTLAIIGVVAALTIPAVITKVTQDQYVVGLKKAFNTLKAVEREAVQENGEMENWDWALNQSDAPKFFETYFKPHFDILKDCGATTDDGCFASAVKYLDGVDDIKTSNSANYYKIITSDGIAINYNKVTASKPAVLGIFIIDVNGKKGPNVWGRDIYYFNVFPSSLGIKPAGTYTQNGLGTSEPPERVNDHCNTTPHSSAGHYCAAKVLSEGAMNY